MGFLCFLIHERLQQFVFFLLLKKTEIAPALYLILEAVELGDIHLLQLDGFADAALVLQLKDSGGISLIWNQEQWTYGEVCPVALPSLLVDVVVMMSPTVEAITLQIVGLLNGLSMLLFL